MAHYSDSTLPIFKTLTGGIAMTAPDTRRHLRLVATSSLPGPETDHHVQEIGPLIETFLDIVMNIARNQDPKELCSLTAFRQEHADFIKKNREAFFSELIEVIKERLRFEARHMNSADRIAIFGMNLPKFPLCFVSQACRLLLLDASPPGSDIPDGETDAALRPLSDEALRNYIVTFRLYDRPWLLFTAIYVAGIRELPTRYSRQGSGP